MIDLYVGTLTPIMGTGVQGSVIFCGICYNYGSSEILQILLAIHSSKTLDYIIVSIIDAKCYIT